MNYQRLYEYRFKGVNQKARQEVWDPIAKHIYEAMGRPAKLLDPAAGRCEFMNSVSAQERWIVDEVDYQEADRSPGIKAVIANIFEADLPKDYFDGIFVSNFLEHLNSQEQVSDFLGRMHRIMKSGGVIAVLGPNFKYCCREYFDCADHTIPLTHLAVEEHLYAAGFELEKTVPRFIPFSFRGHRMVSPRLTSLYLKLPWVWPLFGKQFILFARKQ